MADKLLKLKDVRERLNISKAHLYRLCADGRFQVLNVGRMGCRSNRGVRIRESDVCRFIDSLSTAD